MSIEKYNAKLSKIRDKLKNYTYQIVFFLVFSFFILFIINPTLKTAFKIRKKLHDLEKLDSTYEKIISNIIDVQTNLEETRSDLYVISDAMPDKPKINEVIRDVKTTADRFNLKILKMEINKIDLKESKASNMESFDIEVQVSGKFADMVAFLNKINEQRRLKLVDTVLVDKVQKLSTSSASIQMTVDISSFYM